jgi:hypothetical protein
MATQIHEASQKRFDQILDMLWQSEELHLLDARIKGYAVYRIGDLEGVHRKQQ